MEVAREDISLLEALREDLGIRSVKDGCSPQGQCGCCTVLVDGAARVACVTPVRRVAGRSVTTVDGLAPDVRDRLVAGFVAHGASQCGFCTPGIICRLAALPVEAPAPAAVETALLAHLCRCTGWRSVVDAAAPAGAHGMAATAGPADGAARALLEGGVAQITGPDAVLGRGGFADDGAPEGCLVAVPRAGASGESLRTAAGWSVAATVAEARAGAGKVQGRRSGQPLTYPVDLPPGEWDVTLQTTWVEPAYLEPDASWCEPGGTPASPVANGGAFGGKEESVAPLAARMLADEHGRPVRVLFSREDVVRFGAKRPPVAAGVRRDGTGVLRLGTGPGYPSAPASPRLWETRISAIAPGLTVEVVPVTGPPTSARIRGAGWAEAAVLVAVASSLAAGHPAGGPLAGPHPAARPLGDPRPGGDASVPGTASVTTVDGARVEAAVQVDHTGWPVAVEIDVEAGDPIDETVLRSYVQGAAHMALGWVCSEGIAVDADGHPADLTIRSFGILRARDTPPISVRVAPGPGRPPVRASDAAFAAVAAATWLAQGLPSRWPTMRGTRR